MVLVFESAAAPRNNEGVPTGMVAVTVLQALAARAVPWAEEASAAAAVAWAASASAVKATAVSIPPRCVNLMMSCPLACQWQARYPPPQARPGSPRPAGQYAGPCGGRQRRSSSRCALRTLRVDAHRGPGVSGSYREPEMPHVRDHAAWRWL